MSEPHSYLSVYTNTKGKRVWTCLIHGMPVMAEQESRDYAIAVAKLHFSKAKSIPLWDGDKGEFETDPVPLS